MKDWSKEIATRKRWHNLVRYSIIALGLIGLVVYHNTSQAADAKLIVDIIECESSGRYDAIGDDGISVGIAQFQEVTFNEMKHLAHMPKLRWKNPVHQLRLMIWMIDHDYGDRWTCYRKLKLRK